MLLSKQNLAVLAGVSKIQDNMYALDHVCIDTKKMRIYASDGHCLYRSNIDQSINEEQFLASDVQTTKDPYYIFIHGKELLKAEKTIPKTKYIPVLQNVQILTDENHHYVVTADLDHVNTIRVKRGEKEYPEANEIEEQFSGDPDSHVWLSVKQLEKLVKALKKNGDDDVKIELRGKSSPLVAKTHDGVFVGYIMPLVID